MLPGLDRFLRVIPGGLLQVDKTEAKAGALGRLHWSRLYGAFVTMQGWGGGR